VYLPQIAQVKGWRNPTGGHPISHLSRAQAILDCTRDAASRIEHADPGTKVLRFVDFYGKPRLKWGNGFGCLADPTLAIEYVPYGPQDYAGDLARSVGQQRNRDLPLGCQFSMFVDVYAGTGLDSTYGITPQMVTDACLVVPQRTTYVIQWQLQEPIGAMVYKGSKTVQRGETSESVPVTSCEAYWRTNDKGVAFFPDSESSGYPVGPVSSVWLHQRSIEVDEGLLHIAPISSYGTNVARYSAYVVVLEPHPVASKPVPACPVPESDLVVAHASPKTLVVDHIDDLMRQFVPLVSLLEHGDNFDESNRGVMVAGVRGTHVRSRSLVEVARSVLGLRVISGLVTREAFATAQAAARKNASWVVLEARYPGFLNSVVFNSVTYAMTNCKPVRFVAAIDQDRALSQAHESAQKRIAKADYAGATVPVWSLLSYLRYAIVIHLMMATILGTPYLDPTAWAFPVASVISGWLFTGSIQIHSGSLAELAVRGAGGMKADGVVRWAVMALGVYGAVSEEILRSYYPNVMLGLAVYEFFGYIRLGVAPIVRVPALLMHFQMHSMSPFNFAQRLTSHLLFNIVGVVAGDAMSAAYNGVYAPEIKVTSYQLDVEDFYHWASYWVRGKSAQVKKGVLNLTEAGVHKMRTFIPRFQLPAHFDWRVALMSIRTAARTYIGLDAVDYIETLCVDECCCDHLGLCQNCSDARQVEFVYPTMMTNGFLYAPRNGNASLGVALINRSLRDPTGGMLCDIKTEMAYYARIAIEIKGAAAWLKTLPVTMEKEYTHEECAAAMGGAKGRNYTETLERMVHGDVILRNTIQEKWNEQVKSGSPVNYFLTMHGKPRLICAVSTDEQVLTMGIARGLTDALKKIFNGTNIHDVGGKKVRICLAKADAESLNSYADGMKGSIPMIVISGDDSAYSSGGHRYGPFQSEFGEADYTAYDQSQLKPLWDAFNEFCEAWRLPQAFFDNLWRCIVNAVKGGKKTDGGMKFAATIHPQMFSGMSVTNIVGGLFNIMNYVKAILEDLTIEESSRRIGFTVKHVARDRYEDVTFLRGWWQPTADGDHIWMNLPSACLKLGKIFKDPTSLVKGPGDRAEKTAIVFRAVMESLANVPDDYPLLGAMKRSARQLAGLDARTLNLSKDPYIAENARWKTYGVGKPNREAVLNAMHHRYNLTALEVEEMEKLFLSVTELPCFISHPGFEKLQVADYA